MRRFIVTLFSFILLCAILACMIDFVISKGLSRYTDYTTEVWNDLRDSSFNHDVIVLGSCQAMHDVNPDILDSILGCDSYVLSMSNLTFPCHNFMWNMYKYYHSNMPKMIILILDYGDLSFREVKNSMEDEQFLPLVYNAQTRDFMIQYGGYKWYEIYLPLCRYYGHHQQIKNGVGGFCGIKKGKRNKHKGYYRFNESYSFQAANFDDANIVPIEPELVQMLEGFIADCDSHNVPVVISIPPLGDELANMIANKEELYAVYDSIAKLNECPIWCYPSNEFTADTTYFESPMHLNASGSDIYTNELGLWIKSLNVYQ